MTLRLLSVHAHPDDESSKGAATSAYYRSRGVEVLVVSCTGGERGDILNDALPDRPRAERDIAGLRRREMAEAARILDIQHRWLGYVDSGMANEDGSFPLNSFASVPLATSAEALVRIVRRFRPQVMVTYDENGGYPHPDHIRCHQIAVAAFDAASDTSVYPNAGEPWQVSKLYYDNVFNYQRIKANADTLLAEQPDSPLTEQLSEMLTWMKDRPARATTHVPAGEFFEVRDAALRAHASQVAADSSFFFWPNDLQRRAWPFEDFELARSIVPTEDTESDLFAGIEDME
ncbi:mycothiol conjugate amidase Mca [Mycetocola zhadangensis]|uniref:mycothiol conjugate amidase Mca n=1 Tax=Mycetocola zhadangensis TaxID=1164595 RepID=UPI0015FFED1A|nr:mycothiol conjugate amidase Mca [Mycetocola zhadangensis]GGE84502.1 mycothiol S-conjugate amidase [Mycetocola zhadangensis]